MSNPGSDTASLAHCRRRAKRPFFHLSGLLVGGGEHGSRFALDEGPCVEASRRDPPVRLNFHQLVTLVRLPLPRCVSLAWPIGGMSG